MYENDKSLFSKENYVDLEFEFFRKFKFSVPQMIDQFGRKRCQKKRKDVSFQLQSEFFQKYYVVHEWSAVKNSFSTYVWSNVNSCFCESVFIVRLATLDRVHRYNNCTHEVPFENFKPQ